MIWYDWLIPLKSVKLERNPCTDLFWSKPKSLSMDGERETSAAVWKEKKTFSLVRCQRLLDISKALVQSYIFIAVGTSSAATSGVFPFTVHLFILMDWFI